MLDFGALPPEVNSARIYTGPGPAPMLAAAAAWDALAAQLELYAAGYASVLAELQGQAWSGGASMAMAAAVAPYVVWATATAEQAEQSAAQARTAAAAFEAAFIATVPPQVVAANRIQLAMLFATNFFGQNTPAIAATEAAYAEMWAQDAAAMYAYATSSSAATVLSPFSQPPQTTNAAGLSAQAAAVAQSAGSATGHTQLAVSELMSVLPEQLQALALGSTQASASDPTAAANVVSWTLSAFQTFDTLVVSPAQPFWSTTYAVFSTGQFGTGLRLAQLQAAKNAAKATEAADSAAGAATSGAVRGPVLARAGDAAPVGNLSVPQSWLAASGSDVRSSAPLSMSGTEAQADPAAAANRPMSMLGGMPTGNERKGPPTSLVLRNGRRRFTMPRPSFGG